MTNKIIFFELLQLSFSQYFVQIHLSNQILFKKIPTLYLFQPLIYIKKEKENSFEIITDNSFFLCHQVERSRKTNSKPSQTKLLHFFVD